MSTYKEKAMLHDQQVALLILLRLQQFFLLIHTLNTWSRLNKRARGLISSSHRATEIKDGARELAAVLKLTP